MEDLRSQSTSRTMRLDYNELVTTAAKKGIKWTMLERRLGISASTIRSAVQDGRKTGIVKMKYMNAAPIAKYLNITLHEDKE